MNYGLHVKSDRLKRNEQALLSQTYSIYILSELALHFKLNQPILNISSLESFD